MYKSEAKDTKTMTSMSEAFNIPAHIKKLKSGHIVVTLIK